MEDFVFARPPGSEVGGEGVLLEAAAFLLRAWKGGRDHQDLGGLLIQRRRRERGGARAVSKELLKRHIPSPQVREGELL